MHYRFDLFSSSRAEKLPITISKLSEHPECLDTIARWSCEKWGYLKGLSTFEDYQKDLSKIKDHIYLLHYKGVSLNKQSLVGMFGVVPIPLFLDQEENKIEGSGKEEKEDNMKVSVLCYVYVIDELRGLGLGRYIVNKAKSMIPKDEVLEFDTFNPNLNGFYKKLDGKELCDGLSFGFPTTVFRF